MVPLDSAGPLSAADLLDAIRRRKGIVVLSTAVVVGIVLAISLIRTPVYRASTKVLLQPGASEQILGSAPGGPADNQLQVGTEIEVVKSNSVREKVSRRLGHVVDVEASRIGATNVVQISVESTNAEDAAKSANVYAETYLSTRRQQLIDDLLSGAREVQARVNGLREQLNELDAPIADLDARIAATPEGPSRSALVAQRDDAERRAAPRRDALITQEAYHAQQLDQLQLAGNLIRSGGAHVVSEAELPTSPIHPNPVRDTALALGAGLVFGLGTALLRDHLDDTVRSHDDLQRATGGLGVLASVPLLPDWRRRDEARLVLADDPHSVASEAYRSLRTSLEFVSLDHPRRVIQFSSPSASEGKTTTIANLAVAVAQAGKTVAVVCCDLRRPRVHEFFDVSNDVGFTSLLLGEASLSAALQSVPAHRGIRLLASGPIPPNPSEILSSPRVAELFAAVAGLADVVLVDSPPLLPVTDGVVVARHVDATVLVVHARTTTRRSVHRAIELLQQVSAPLVGTVLNGVEKTETYGYREYGTDLKRGTAPEDDGHGNSGTMTADTRRFA